MGRFEGSACIIFVGVDKIAAGGNPAGPGLEVLGGRKLQGVGVGTADFRGCESSETCGGKDTRLVIIEG